MKKAKKRKCKECAEISKRFNKHIFDQMKLEDFRAKQVINWIRNGTKPAVLSFTSGNERQIAYAVEEFWLKSSENRLTVERPAKFRAKKGNT